MALTKVPGNLLNASLADLANVSSTSPSTNQVLKWNGSTWAPADASVPSGTATESYVTTQISNLVDSSPSALNTLNELAAAIGDDANFSTTITNSIATKLPLAGGTLTGALTLGGNLNVGSYDIVTSSNGNIDLDPHGSGKVVFKGNSTRGAGQFVLNCENNSHGITIKGPPHSAGASYTLTLPNDDGSSNQVLKTDGSGNLSWTTITPGVGGIGSSTTTQIITLSSANKVGIGQNVGNAGALLHVYQASGSGDLLKVQTGGGTHMLMNSSGNLGIGTSSPSQLLDVNGTVELNNLTVGGSQGSDGQVLTSTGSGVQWEDAGVGGIGSSTTTQIITLSSANKVGIGQNVGNALARLHVYQQSGSSDMFKVQNAGGAGMTMDSSGNLGIGTSSPSQLLDVNGTVELNNLTVGGSQGSDGQVLTSTGSGVQWEDAGGAYNDFAIKTGNYTAVNKDQLIVNSSSAVTITLPASPSAGNVVFIKNAGTGTVTVARNGSNINSTADNGELAADAGATLVYVDSTIGWKEL